MNQANIKCFKEENCYDTLETFFYNCTSPMDFFMQLDFINDAFIDTQSRTITLRQTNLNTLCEAIENGPCSMCCVQQVLILMYGIMARFGHYNTIIENIVVEPSFGDFRIEIWRSFDLNLPIYPWRSHHMMVIDMWNGQDEFFFENSTVDKLLVDPWINRYMEWNINEIFLFFRPKFSFYLFTGPL